MMENYSVLAMNYTMFTFTQIYMYIVISVMHCTIRDLLRNCTTKLVTAMLGLSFPSQSVSLG